MNLRILLLAFVALVPIATPAQVGISFEQPESEATFIADTKAIEAGKPFTVGVLIKLKEGWHTYWHYVGDTALPTKVEWQLPPGFKTGPLQWPMPESILFAGSLQQYGYEHEVLLMAEVTPPATLPAGEVKLAAKVDWQACKEQCISHDHVPLALALPAGPASKSDDAAVFDKFRALLPRTGKAPFELAWKPAMAAEISGIPKDATVELLPVPPSEKIVVHPPTTSVPQEDGERFVTFPIKEGGAPGSTWHGVLAIKKADGSREAWAIGEPTASTAAPVAASNEPAPAPTRGLLGVLGAALLGGLILNVMPCVLPVIALKIFGFMNQAHEDPKRIFRLGLAFTAGVFVFFLLLAGIAIVLQRSGDSLAWGAQFQDPRILAALIAAVFIFALSMVGVFEITLGSGAATQLDALAHKEGLGGAFLHGLFTTLLGTSCTAPFLGGALGFAVVQPPPIIILIFLTVAAGMSLPYLLLTWQPAWIKHLPKPGVWMERVKQVLGFGMLAVVVWLYGVFIDANGADTGAALGWQLLALAGAAWVLGAFRRNLFTWLAVLVLAGGTYFLALHGRLEETTDAPDAPDAPLQNDPNGIAWQRWSQAAVDEALGQGHPVFVDFTAKWCANCKTNEHFVIETEPVRAAIREKQIVALRGDYTKHNAAIKAELLKYGHNGVPLYLYYASPGAKPVVFPEILTQSMVLEAFNQSPP